MPMRRTTCIRASCGAVLNHATEAEGSSGSLGWVPPVLEELVPERSIGRGEDLELFEDLPRELRRPQPARCDEAALPYGQRVHIQARAGVVGSHPLQVRPLIARVGTV